MGVVWVRVASIRVSGNTSKGEPSGVGKEPADEHSSLEEQQVLGGDEFRVLQATDTEAFGGQLREFGCCSKSREGGDMIRLLL